jgi:hypothetical protein
MVILGKKYYFNDKHDVMFMYININTAAGKDTKHYFDFVLHKNTLDCVFTRCSLLGAHSLGDEPPTYSMTDILNTHSPNDQVVTNIVHVINEIVMGCIEYGDSSPEKYTKV